ncbi:hypothetical protein Bpfe_004153, partial [Biomphalaria pfeifferi]
ISISVHHLILFHSILQQQHNQPSDIITFCFIPSSSNSIINHPTSSHSVSFHPPATA